MKRLVLAIILFAAAILSAAGMQYVVKKCTDETIAAVAKCYDSESSDEALKNAEVAVESWKKNKRYLSMILEHTELEDTEKCFFELEYRIEAGDRETDRLCREIVSLLKNTKDSVKPEIENIL